MSNNSNFKPPESGFDILPDKTVKNYFSFVNGATEIKNEILEVTLINHKGKKRKNNKIKKIGTL